MWKEHCANLLTDFQQSPKCIPGKVHFGFIIHTKLLLCRPTLQRAWAEIAVSNEHISTLRGHLLKKKKGRKGEREKGRGKEREREREREVERGSLLTFRPPHEACMSFHTDLLKHIRFSLHTHLPIQGQLAHLKKPVLNNLDNTKNRTGRCHSHTGSG